MSNILVTGSMGFIGGHIAAKLKELGHAVIGFDKKAGSSTVAYAQSHKLIQEHFKGKMDMIVHCGGSCSTQHSIDQPGEDFVDNALGTMNAAQLARAFNAKIIYTSSCKVVPNEAGERTPYGLSKLVGEMYLEEFNKMYGVEYIINRMGTIYGPGQQGSAESGWVAHFVKCKVENEPVIIYGDGSQIRDILYIDDLVALLVDQVDNFERYQNKIFDVGGGDAKAISIKSMLEEVLEYDNFAFGKARKGDVKEFVSDNVHISAVNGWKPTVSINEGIEKTLESYK